MARFAALASFTVPSVAQLASSSTHINDPDHIQRLNSEEEISWVAAHQPFFEGLSFEDARSILGARLSHISKHVNETRPELVYASLADGDLPSDFDARTQWPDLVHPIRNQERCGSCWAFSASEVLGDRVAIATGVASPVLSPEDMVSCDKNDMGCNGGSLPVAWQYLTSTGIVSDACMPYKAGGGLAPACSSTCTDSESFVRTKAKSAYAINGPSNMQKELMTNGPIQVGFKVYQSFMSYKSGVYHKLKSDIFPEGGHAVKMVGWGVDGKRAYWVVANSWGTSWGEEGFFRILRGKNHCGIEEMGPPYAGLPLIEGSEEIIVV